MPANPSYLCSNDWFDSVGQRIGPLRRPKSCRCSGRSLPPNQVQMMREGYLGGYIRTVERVEVGKTIIIDFQFIRRLEPVPRVKTIQLQLRTWDCTTHLPHDYFSDTCIVSANLRLNKPLRPPTMRKGLESRSAPVIRAPVALKSVPRA